MQKLRLGVIGTGSVVREIYQYLYFHSDYSRVLSVEAACDPNEEMLTEFCEKYGVPTERRFSNYQDMIEAVELDAVHVNTPDHIHRDPTIAAIQAGLDVLVPKPTAATVKDAHAMIRTAKETGRLLAIDFHKREDPRIKEATARYRQGRYGPFQVAVWYMIDKLMVADPNHEPRFFATDDFAAKNTPISFLTVHMADAFMQIIGLRPRSVRAVGYKQKLPSLTPIAVQGYDCVDTEVVFENGGTAHIITGWHLPNTAHATTVQDARIVCRDGMLDLSLDRPGYHELTHEGIMEINPLFRNFEPDGRVTGYGISNPGRLLERFLMDRNGDLSDDVKQQMADPVELGFYTTLLVEAAEGSLERGAETAPGVVTGETVDLAALVEAELGAEAAADYMG